MVLDDVPDAEVLRGLWPRGPEGRVVITTGNARAFANLQDLVVLELGAFSPREAMTYLVSRLSKDPDQRRGAIDLIQDLGCQPLALAEGTAAELCRAQVRGPTQTAQCHYDAVISAAVTRQRQEKPTKAANGESERGAGRGSSRSACTVR